MRHVLLLAIVSVLFASPSDRNLYRLYQDGKYLEACDLGAKGLRHHQKDEKYIALYAFACLQADRIDRLALPVVMLRHSKESRKNAAYFSVILMQKQLLVQALENGESLYDLNVPTTDYVLSKVFELYGSAPRKTVKQSITLQDRDDPRRNYRVYLQKRKNTVNLAIEEYYDTIMTRRHIYR